MLSCLNLTAIFDDQIIFKQLGFTLFPGSVLLVIGKNGSGKTTLLKMLSGFEAGQVEHDSQIAYISHKTSFKSSLSVSENLSFWANIYDSPELVPAAMAYFGLGPLAESQFGLLSAGWKQRAVLAKLMLRPEAKIWLLDEPETHLDHDGQKLLTNLVASRAGQGGTIIITTHLVSLWPAHAARLDIEDFGG